MITEPTSLRARLLDAEPVSAAHRRRLEQELNAMFDDLLSRRARWYWRAALIAAIALACLGAAVLAWGRGLDGFGRAIWWTYTLANAAFAVFAGWVLRRGRLDIRRLLAVSKLSPALTLLITLLLFIRAANNPTPEAVLWVLFGIICLLVALAVTVYNRVVAAEWRQREQALRMELRIEDLIERLGGDDGAGATSDLR